MQEYLSTIRTLKSVLENRRSLDASFSDNDSPLAKQICYGVIRNYFQLRHLVQLLLDKPLPKKHFDLQILLLAGIYSINSLNRPAHASVNAVVEATTGLNKKWAKKLINGVLRNYIRKQTILDKEISSHEEAATNHPSWLLTRLQSSYPDQYKSIIDANNHQAPMTLRVNLAQISRESYQEQLSKKDIPSRLGKFAASAIYLDKPVQVDQLPGFSEGLASVQDEASQLVAGLLNVKSNHRVLDACAAPGGKTCHILELNPDIDLTALDIDERRLKQVHENLERLKLHCHVANDDLNEHQVTTKYDRILLDAPCSATGIIRRHPDIKLLRRDSDIDKLAATQLKLLETAWNLLKDNGELVYSTCSILPIENELVVASFVKSNDSVQVLPITSDWGQATGTGKQLLPDRESTDGFFYARLKKLPV